MKCNDICKAIDKLAPQNLAYDRDNVGLLVGDRDKEVKKVMVCVDNDMRVLDEAIAAGVDMIISHHPVMFDPIKRINSDTAEGRFLLALCRSGISHYAAHTNLDIAKGGINDVLAKAVGIKEPKILEYTTDVDGIGRIGELEREMTLREFTENLKKNLGAECVRVCGDENRVLKSAAVSTGGGAGLLHPAFYAGADVFVSGDFHYNDVCWANSEDFCVVDVSHYDSEQIATKWFYDALKEAFGDEIEVIITKTEDGIWKNR